MARQLILVTEVGFTDSEEIARFELWAEDGFKEEEWWCTKAGGVWTKESTREIEGVNLPDALLFYGGPMSSSEYWLSVPEARLRGVAYCAGLTNTGSIAAKKVARRILISAEEGEGISNKYSEELFQVFLGTFSQKYPRDITGDGCWAVQFKGFLACKLCVFDETSLCLGQNIIETGTNSLGKDIPITQYFSQPE